MSITLDTLKNLAAGDTLELSDGKATVTGRAREARGSLAWYVTVELPSGDFRVVTAS